MIIREDQYFVLGTSKYFAKLLSEMELLLLGGSINFILVNTCLSLLTLLSNSSSCSVVNDDTAV
jgi:hypothetical protein